MDIKVDQVEGTSMEMRRLGELIKNRYTNFVLQNYKNDLDG